MARFENIIFFGSHNNLKAEKEIRQKEGQVFCNILRRPMPGITSEHPRRLYKFPPPDPSDEGAQFLLANVDCRVYTDQQPIIERFGAAMRTLQHRLVAA